MDSNKTKKMLKTTFMTHLSESTEDFGDTGYSLSKHWITRSDFPRYKGSKYELMRDYTAARNVFLVD